MSNCFLLAHERLKVKAHRRWKLHYYLRLPMFFSTGVKIYIDSRAQLSLLGTEMDYVEDKLASEFVFNNPNIKGVCGCGESFHL